VSDLPKPATSFRAHAGPYEGRPVEEIVQDPAGRAWLAAHISAQGPGRQRIGLAWLSWALQRQITPEDLGEIAGG
jgi:hypothetical protein